MRVIILSNRVYSIRDHITTSVAILLFIGEIKQICQF